MDSVLLSLKDGGRKDGLTMGAFAVAVEESQNRDGLSRAPARPWLTLDGCRFSWFDNSTRSSLGVRNVDWRVELD
jgi:hypothetical protein